MTTTNNASVVAANELNRISNVLTAYDVSPKLGSEDGADGWLPGDPIHRRPNKGVPGHQWTRPMLELHPENYDDRRFIQYSEEYDELFAEHWEPTCVTCEVSWDGPDPCWMCGKQTRRMQSAAALLEELRRSSARSGVRFMPAVADSAAPTVNEMSAAQPVPGLTWAEPRPEAVDLLRRLIDSGTIHHDGEPWRLTRSARSNPVDDLMAASLAMTTEGFRRSYLAAPRRNGRSEFYSNRQRVLDAVGPRPVSQYRDPAWETVVGVVTYDDSHPGVPKYTIELRHAGDTVGACFYLDARQDFAKMMHRAVKAITYQMAYRGGRSAGA